jgi:GH25 family lysozyme M1 (1,4-beta-N-acetylmuramidase)
MDIAGLEWGPDVNGWWPVLDWEKLAASGATFFAAKACEGAHTVDHHFEAHRDGFRQHCGTFTRAVWYTMFHFEKDPAAQADLLARTVGELGPRETLCCDFEGTSYGKVAPSIVTAHGLSYLEAFYARLDVLGVLPAGVRPMIYTSNRHWLAIGNPAWERAEKIDLWVPRYASPEPKEPKVLPKPWRSWTVLQWTDNDTGISAPVPGIGRCDVNVLAG